MLRLVSSTGTSPTDPASVQPEDDSNDGAKEKKSSREREKDKDKDGVTTSLSAMLNTDGTREVTELIKSYSPKAMGEICIKVSLNQLTPQHVGLFLLSAGTNQAHRHCSFEGSCYPSHCVAFCGHTPFSLATTEKHQLVRRNFSFEILPTSHTSFHFLTVYIA